MRITSRGRTAIRLASSVTLRSTLWLCITLGETGGARRIHNQHGSIGINGMLTRGQLLDCYRCPSRNDVLPAQCPRIGACTDDTDLTQFWKRCGLESLRRCTGSEFGNQLTHHVKIPNGARRIGGNQHARIGLAQYILHIHGTKTGVNWDQYRANLGDGKQNVQPLGAVREP